MTESTARLRWPVWQKALAFSLVYFLGARIGQSLLLSNSPTVTFWLPSGIFVATLLLSPPSTWPVYLLAALPANFCFDLLQGRPWHASLLFFAGNAAEALLGAWLTRRFAGQPFALNSLRSFINLVLFSVLFGTAVNATFGALVILLVFGAASYWITWLSWWSGAALGVLVMAPVILTWAKPGLVLRRLRARRLEIVICALVLALVVWQVFLSPSDQLLSRAYIVLPVLIWLALRFDPRVIALCNLGLALVSVWGAKQGLGAFAGSEPSLEIQVVSLQIYLSTTSVTTLILSLTWSERNQGEERLRESESALKKAQRVAHVGSWAWHMQENRLEWSDEMYAIFGIEKEHFSGVLSDVMASAIHPDDRAAVESSNLSVMREKRPIPLEYRVVWPDGTIRTVWAEAGELVSDQHGSPAILTGIVQDISARKQNELQILRLARLYRALSQVNQLITRVEERTALFDGVCRIMTRDGEFKGAWISWLDAQGGMIMTLAQAGLVPPEALASESLTAPCQPDEWSPARRALHECRTVVAGSLAQSRSHPAFSAAGFAAWAATPIQDGGEMGGTLNVFSDEADFFQEQEINLLEEAAMDIAFALDHIHHEAERRQSELSLRESEARLALAQQIARVGYWERNYQTNQAIWSDETYRMYDLPPSVDLNDIALLQTRIHPEDLPGFVQAIQDAQDGLRPYDHEYRVVHLDGSIHFIHSRGAVTRDEQGHLLGMVGSSMDITQRKLDEEKIKVALHDKETLLRELYHRTKNNMQVIRSMLVLQSAASENEEVRRLVEATEGKIHAMALVHEMLYQSQNLSSIDLKTYIAELAAMMVSQYTDASRQINLRLDLEPIFVTFDTATPLGLVLNELLSNACQHAFVGKSEGEIGISLARRAADKIRLEFYDTGSGLPPGLDLRSQTSFGMMSIFALAERQLNGQVQFQSSNGLHYVIEFPDQVYKPRV